ncbi:MAG: hydrolase, partial [Chloroflexi bacterium]|nr:hydrolase [Chloroflexota bacterium]
KIHLYDAFGHKESDKIKPGDGETLTFQLGGITFGAMTCYDVRFPELARCLVDRGAEAIVLPSGWVHGLLKEDHWEILVRARAIENTVYVVACDQVKNIYSGSSMVVDPLGVVRARAGEEPELLMGELTPDRIREARLKLPSLLHRRFSVRLEKAVPTVTG